MSNCKPCQKSREAAQARRAPAPAGASGAATDSYALKMPNGSVQTFGSRLEADAANARAGYVGRVGNNPAYQSVVLALLLAPMVVVRFDGTWLTFVVAVILPAVVALVTKASAKPVVKTLVLLALSAITAILSAALTNGNSLDLVPTLQTFVITYVTAVVSHFGLLKPAGLSGAESKVANATGGIG